MDMKGILNETIYVHDQAYYYSNAIDNDHISDCSDFCKNIKMRNGLRFDSRDLLTFINLLSQCNFKSFSKRHHNDYFNYQDY